MRHPYILATVLNVILLMAASGTLHYKFFELEANLDREKLTKYLSSVLCSIDLKHATIYFELESAGEFLDDIVARSSKCEPATLTITTYQKDGVNVATNTSDGACLIILIAREFEYENSMFPKLLRIRKQFNYELFYMIVSEVKMSADHENLLKLIYVNYNLLNVVVVAMENNSSDPTVITYNPFASTIIRIPNNMYKKKQLFVNKNSNIFGSPLNIVTHKDQVTSLTLLQGSKMMNFNYDALLPELISSAMNATLILKDPHLREGSEVRDIGAVDLIINGKSYESRAILGTGIERTIITRRDDICLLLRYRRSRNTFEIIYRTVDPFVWMLMIAVILQAWISLLVIRCIQSVIQRCKLWKNVYLFDLFGFHLNQGLTHMPKEAAPRLIIASSLMYCLVIKSIFEGLLYTSMANTKDTRISTIDELLNSNEYEIIIGEGFYNTSEHIIKQSPINNHFKLVEYWQYIQRIESNKNHYAFVLRRRVANYFETTKIVNGTPVYYTMDECVVPFIVGYYVRQGSPFLDRINQVLRISEESGLFNYWEKRLGNAYKTLKQSERLFVHRPAITFKQLVFVFQALICGLAIATTVFVYELCATKFKTGAKNWCLAKRNRIHRKRVKWNRIHRK